MFGHVPVYAHCKQGFGLLKVFLVQPTLIKVTELNRKCVTHIFQNSV